MDDHKALLASSNVSYLGAILFNPANPESWGSTTMLLFGVMMSKGVQFMSVSALLHKMYSAEFTVKLSHLS